MSGQDAGGRPATVHGVYDYWLGGGQHLRADRELGKAIEEEFPSVPVHVRAAKEFHLRAARWCAGRGISRFIRAGAVTWVPEGRNLHEAVLPLDPAAQVVYVNRDEEAYDWARALLAVRPGVTAARARVSEPAALLAAPPVAGLLAPREPVCMVIGMVLAFASPRGAGELIAAYAAALPRGSVIALSVPLADCSPQADRLIAMYAPARIRRHTAQDVTGWLEGAGLKIIPPGVCDVRAAPVGGRPWMTGTPARPPGSVAGVLAVKP